MDEDQNPIESNYSYRSKIQPRSISFDQIHLISNDFPPLNQKRRDEQRSLIELNDQFAKYLQTIQYLTIENDKLTFLIQIIQNSHRR